MHSTRFTLTLYNFVCSQDSINHRTKAQQCSKFHGQKQISHVFLPVNIFGRWSKLDMPVVWLQAAADTGSEQLVRTFVRRLVVIIYLLSSFQTYQCDECNIERLFQSSCTLLIYLISKTSFLLLIVDSINLTNKIPHKLLALILQQ